MREQLKQRYRDMIATLEKGETVLYSRIRETDKEALEQLFEDMQNSAIAIGSAIEQEEGEGTETVSLLENYCELLWQYMAEEDVNGRLEAAGRLAGKREEMTASLDAEFPGRLEIVFLVGRRDAWKGMEHFLNLLKDQADCYVVTAPCWADEALGKDADLAGIAGAMEFKDYDFRERMPDIVFVDGPYEEPGRPGAAPGFQFSAVRQNAGLVLYLPYHGADARIDQTQCEIPQVKESDMILLSSNEIRHDYIKIMAQMKGSRSLLSKLCETDAVDGETLLKRSKAGIRRNKRRRSW